ncbi:MAG: hypothetical protein SVR08_08100 [Spirochaetota bacterium]|nr:hypothetical protein [Spirochaetota bacterium]
MKRVAIILLLLFLITAITDASDFFSKEEASDVEIEHYITYSHRSTRSESRHGFIKINGKTVPSVFLLIKYRNLLYEFYQRTYLWGRDGYFPVNARQVNDVFKKSNKGISKKHLSKGWYLGNEYLKNTPSNWIYVQWRDGDAFVSSEKIDEMVKSLRLKAIPRRKPMATRIRTRNR